MHHHSSLGWLTRWEVHYGHAAQRLSNRKLVLRQAFEANPERFVRGVPTPPTLPTAVWINRPKAQEDSSEAFDTKVLPEVSHSC